MNKRYPSNSGFSLVELTVVLLIITLLASVAVRETSELAFQTRYEQTKERLDMIKQAILGNPRQIINGQQAVSGFVADMGRLPRNIHELLEKDYCLNDRAVTDPLVCTTNFGINAWIQQTSDASDVMFNTSLRYGWRGPYLNVIGSPADADAFPDGWGSLAPEAPHAQTQNYGWILVDGFNINSEPPHTTNSNRLVVQSYGKDQQVGGTDYDADYPENRYSVDNSLPYTQPAPLVDQEDWLVDISGGISVNITKQYGTNKSCGFAGPATAYTTQASCENAGGTWGTSCTFGEDSCKSVGGKWNTCVLAPSACTATGGVFQMRCQFTEKACNAAGGPGSWDTTARTCLIDSTQTNCTNAGGSWNTTASRCEFNESSCSLAGGALTSDCAFTAATCPTATTGVTWVGTTPKPDSCNFTQAACTSLNGMSLGDDYCYMSHGENIGVKYDVASCASATGSWAGNICLKVFYRDPVNATISTFSSNAVVIRESGLYQTIQFSFNNPPLIPVGQNAIGIYEHDGTNCTNTPYPADRQNPIQVDFHAHTTLPVINW